MGYLVKAILGAALFIGGTVLFNVKLVELLETGTCASGNQPFEIARECPAGIETVALLMVAGLFGALIGTALFLLRGRPPWSQRRQRFTGMFGWGTFAWGLFFSGSGAAILIASRTSETIPQDGELGGTIVGITFLVMGVPALAIAAWSLVTSLGDRDERPATATAASGGLGTLSGGAAGSMSEMMRSAQGMLGQLGSTGAGRTSGDGDAISQLERLQRLRDSGALTEDEFQRQKARVLGEM